MAGMSNQQKIMFSLDSSQVTNPDKRD